MKKYSDDFLFRVSCFEDLASHFHLILLLELVETLEYFCVDFRLLARYLTSRVIDAEMVFNCFSFMFALQLLKNLCV